MKSRLLLFISISFLASCSSLQTVRFDDDVKERVTEIPADPSAGFHWPGFLYIPERVSGKDLPLIVITNNTPSNSDDYQVHYNQAKRKILQYRSLSDNTGLPLLICALPRFMSEVPGDESIFSRDIWMADVQSLTRNALLTECESLQRIDLQVLCQVDSARALLESRNLTTSEKFIMFGFSSSASFANRFTLLHPDRVLMEIAGAPGGWFTLPVSSWKGQELRFQVGTSDVERLTGIPFDAQTFRSVPRFFFVGSEDEDDAVPYADSYTYEDRITILKNFGVDHMERYIRNMQVFEEEGFPVHFRVYDNTGHYISSEMKSDICSFIENNR